MISAFGPKAERYGAVLAGRNVVIAEPAHILPAYLEAIRRRECGESFYGMLLMEEQRTRVIELVAPAIFAQLPGFDERRGAMDQVGRGDAIVNGKPVRELFTAIDPTMHQVTAEFFLLSNAVLVRSHTEYARINALGGRPRAFERIVAVPVLPPIERRRPVRPGIVVWVTEVGAEASAFYARTEGGDSTTELVQRYKIDVAKLARALEAALRTARPEVRTIVRERVSLLEQMDAIARTIRRDGRASFFALCANGDRLTVIVTFLAVLELVRRGRLIVQQAVAFDDIELLPAAPVEVPRAG